MPFLDPEAKKEYQRKWVAKRRANFFADKKCEAENCNRTDKLTLDHINPKTKVSHSIWSWSEKRIAEEVSKCQVLCEDHHKEKTRKNGDYGKHTLTREEVEEIRKLYATGKYLQKELATKFETTQRVISHVVNRTRWK